MGGKQLGLSNLATLISIISQKFQMILIIEKMKKGNYFIASIGKCALLAIFSLSLMKNYQLY